MLVAVRARFGDGHTANRIAQLLRIVPGFMRTSCLRRMRLMVGVFSMVAVASMIRMVRLMLP